MVSPFQKKNKKPGEGNIERSPCCGFLAPAMFRGGRLGGIQGAAGAAFANRRLGENHAGDDG